MKTSTLLLMLASLSISLAAHAQRAARPLSAQASVVAPLGTRGAQSREVANDISLNLLYGDNGGLDGFEVGGLVNRNRGAVSGVQVAGVLNLVHADSRGARLGGIANVTRGESSGLGIAAGGNFSGGDASGVELGIVNVNSAPFSGLRLGGVNVSRRSRGLQIGVINVVGEVDGGVVLGLVNVVRDGLFELEASANEIMYANLTYRMGGRHLYTVYRLGWTTYEGEDAQGYGLGLGTILTRGERVRWGLELSATHVRHAERPWRAREVNLLTRLEAGCRIRLAERVGLTVGPALNLYLTEQRVGEASGTLAVPYTLGTRQLDGGGRAMWWIGAQAGLAVALR